MNLNEFTKEQRQALLDLLILAMYTDGNLASVEEARVKEVLTSMGWTTDYDRNREFDAAVTRIRQHAQTAELARACAAKLAQYFTVPEQRNRVYGIVSELTALDGQVSPEEGKFLAVVREVFKM